MKRITLFLISLVLIATSACKKTIEGETTSWEENKVRLKKLKATYPSFAGLLDQELKDAETKWKEAKSVNDEKQKIKVMAEANFTFDKGFVYELGILETKLQDISAKSKDLSRQMTAKDVKLSKSELKMVIDVNDNVKETLLGVEKILNKGIKSEEKGFEVIKRANQSLYDADKSLQDAKRIIEESKTVKPKKEGKDAKDSTKKSTKTTKTKEKE